MEKLKLLISKLNTRQKIAAVGALIVIFNYESFRYISCEIPNLEYGHCSMYRYSTLEQNLFWTTLAIFIAAAYFLGDKKED